MTRENNDKICWKLIRSQRTSITNISFSIRVAASFSSWSHFNYLELLIKQSPPKFRLFHGFFINERNILRKISTFSSRVWTNIFKTYKIYSMKKIWYRLWFYCLDIVDINYGNIIIHVNHASLVSFTDASPFSSKTKRKI